MPDDKLLAAIFGSEAFARVMAVFADRPGELLSAGEVERLSGVRSRDSLYRAINRGVQGGLLLRRTFGRTGAYEVNTQSPLYPDIKSLLSMLIGVAAEIRDALAHHPGVKSAFIYGSAAAGRDAYTSDVDLFVIGEVEATALITGLEPIEMRLGREINATTMSPEVLRRRLAIGDPFLTNVWSKPRTMLVGDEASLPRPAIHEPGPYFHQEMATLGTAKTYTTAVVGGIPGGTGEVTEQALDEVEAWVQRTKPEARAERANPQVGWWQVVPSSDSLAVWQTWLYPGPVISVRSLTPTTPRDNDAAIALRALAGWWVQTLQSIIDMMIHLEIEDIQAGLTINPYGSGNEPRLIDVDFAGLISPTRGSVPGQVPPWSFTTQPLTTHEPTIEIVVPAVRSLLRHYSFRHLEETIRSLSTSLLAVGGR